MRKSEKIGLIIGVVANIIPIALSALVDNNITNNSLRHIVWFCYSIRFELVCLLIFLLVLLFVVPLLKKLIKKDRYYFNTSIFVVLMVIGLSESYINILRIGIDRRSYFTNNFNRAEIQLLPFKEANKQLNNKEYDRARDTYSVVVNLQNDGYFTVPAKDKIERIDKILSLREDLYSEFDISRRPYINFTDYKGIEYLTTVFPGYYDYYYNNTQALIVQSISDYKKLYDAVNNDDFEMAQDLIKENGWCWFEKIVWDKFTSGSRSYLMRIIKEYLASETISDAEVRLCKKWNVSL